MAHKKQEEITLQGLLLLRAPFALPELRLFRRNVGGGRLQGGHVVKFGIKGQCDLYGLVRGGRHLEIELKASAGELSDKQEAWRTFCDGWGVPWVALYEYPNETKEETVERWIAILRTLV
jgi:hypothetical protein